MMGSIALCDDSMPIAEYQTRVSATYSDALFPLIEQILHSAGLTIHDVEGYAVALGPGSFTALRIGLSMVKGLAFSTGRPVVGIGSLDGLAQNVYFTNLPICPLFDARKGEVYAALYKNDETNGLSKISPERAVNPETLCAEFEERVIFLGDGSDVYRKTLSENLGTRALFAPPHLRYPRASSIAFLALKKFQKNEVSEVDLITPLYVRPPEAEVKFKGQKINT